MSLAKKEIDMSKQTCNYCKENGHRIHAMDAFGVYLSDCDGQRILACPILVTKKVKLQKTVEEEFPALSGGPTPSSAATVGIYQSIETAKKEKRHQDWLNRQAQKEAWQEKQRQKELEHAEEMKIKYGPKWHWCVENNPDEDCNHAYTLRCKWEEEEMRLEDEEYYQQREEEKREEVEYLQKLSECAGWQEEDDLADELEASWLAECLTNESAQNAHRYLQRKREEYYQEMGWLWDPRG